MEMMETIEMIEATEREPLNRTVEPEGTRCRARLAHCPVEAGRNWAANRFRWDLWPHENNPGSERPAAETAWAGGHSD